MSSSVPPTTKYNEPRRERVTAALWLIASVVGWLIAAGFGVRAIVQGRVESGVLVLVLTACFVVIYFLAGRAGDLRAQVDHERHGRRLAEQRLQSVIESDRTGR